MSVLIKNGTIVTAVDEFVGDVYIEDEKIVAIGENLTMDADEVVDASGKYVLPGGIDQHVHYTFNYKGEAVAGFETTNAAIVGGSTTIIEFAMQEEGKGLVESIEGYDKGSFAELAMTDYAFHGVVCDPSDKTFEEIKSLPKDGISTVKLFMAYKGLPFHSDDSALYKALCAAKEAGVTVMVHCENGDIINTLQQEHLDRGETGTYSHVTSRPPIVEQEATHRAIQIANLAGAPIYVVHVTTKEVMETIRDANNRGIPVTGETCSHYLVLDKKVLDQPNFEGAKYVCSPALRGQEDRDGLWEAIDNGWLNAVSSDHCGFNWAKQKHMGVDDFTNIPNGSPGVQDRLGILWTYGVEKGRISRQRLVDLYSTTPAKVNGLDHRKGHIGVGFDADIVIYDPNQTSIFSNETSLHGVDFSIYEGMEKIGKVDKVFLRGNLMVEDGEFVGKQGDGKRIKSKPYGLAYGNKKSTEKVNA